MSDPPSPPLGEKNSLQRQFLTPDINRNRMYALYRSNPETEDFSSGGDIATNFAAAPEEQEGISLRHLVPESQCLVVHNVDTGNQQQHCSPPQKKRKKTTADERLYAMKRLWAPFGFYSAYYRQVDGIDGRLVGIVTQIPKKANSFQFYIDWHVCCPQMPESVDRDELKNWHDNTPSTRLDIRNYIEKYDEMVANGLLETALAASFSTDPPVMVDLTEEVHEQKPPAAAAAAASKKRLTQERAHLGRELEQVDDLKPAAVAQKRNRLSFAKKKVWAPFSFFSNDGFPIDGINGRLVGFIKEIPRKANNYRFNIDWQVGSPGMPPTVDTTRLRSWYDGKTKNNAIRNQLQVYIQDFEVATTNGTINQGLSLSFGLEMPDQQQVSVAKVATTTPRRAPINANSSGNTVLPTPVRYGRRAAVSTFADHSSVEYAQNNSSRINDVERMSLRSDLFRDGPVECNSDSDVDMNDDVNEAMFIQFHGDGEDEDDTQDEDEERTTEDHHENQSCRTELISKIEWNFERVNLEHELRPRQDFYHGPTGLRPGVASRFSNPAEAFSYSGGMTRDFVSKLVVNSNHYFHETIKGTLGPNNHFCGIKWKNISIAEMYRFLGILLKISMMPRDGGGYRAYFEKEDKRYYTGPDGTGESTVFSETAGWAWKYLTECRFKQIRSAFHPEMKDGGLGGDKCYNLRSAINHLNVASKYSFVPSGNLAFDEGGIACRSRMCPIRQYNKDKPDPYRVDFFVLADHPPADTDNTKLRTGYPALHVDVYQGANSMKVNIDERAAALPTTMRAVVNAVYQLDLQNDTQHGYRTITMDNRYQCPELAFILRERCNILSTGTCRQNRKGWPKAELQMKKTKDGNRGESLIYYDKVNEIMAFQWMDTKVVNCCSSIIDNSLLKTTRRVGSSLIELKVPRPLKTYHQFMNAVDKGDQGRLHMGGFARKAHFKKWYKKTFFAVLDFMLMNAHVAWNLSCLQKGRVRVPMKRHVFYMWIAEAFLNYKDEPEEDEEDLTRAAAGQSRTTRCDLFRPTTRHNKCIVCRLDSKYSHNTKGLKQSLFHCRSCNVYVHNHQMPDEEMRGIHEDFPGMTCHDIFCSPTGKEIWKFQNNKQRVNKSHPVVKGLVKKNWVQVDSMETETEDDSSK